MSDADDTIHAPQRQRVRQLAAVGVPLHTIRQLAAPQLELSDFSTIFAPDLALGAAEADKAVAEALFMLAQSGKSVQVTLAWARERFGWAGESEASRHDIPPDAADGWAGLQALMDEVAALKAGSSQPAREVDKGSPTQPVAAAS